MIFGKKSGKTKDDAHQELLTAQLLLNDEIAEEFGDEDDRGNFTLSAEHRRGRFIDNDHPRIIAVDLGDMLAVEYYGPDYGAGWNIFLETIGKQFVADHIGDLRIGGPDQGANGMRTYNLSALAKKDVTFPGLLNLWIRPTESGDHNFSEVGEKGFVKVLKGMPALEMMTLPSAPRPGFFKIDFPHLKWLRIGSGFETNQFIANLAKAKKLPQLNFLDFGDSLEGWTGNDGEIEDASYRPASYADYEALFRSDLMEQLWGIRLRNTQLKKKEYQKLQKIRPECQFSIVLDTGHSYVSHWNLPEFVPEHMLPNG